MGLASMRMKALGEYVYPSKHRTYNICVTFIHCWTNVGDVGPSLYKCYKNVL